MKFIISGSLTLSQDEMFPGVQSEPGESVRLHCPHCGGNYIHQGVVVTCNRRTEDGDGRAVTVYGARLPTFHSLNNNQIQGRRDSLYIHFYCEQCEPGGAWPNGGSWLEILQEKGETYLRWFPDSEARTVPPLSVVLPRSKEPDEAPEDEHGPYDSPYRIPHWRK